MQVFNITQILRRKLQTTRAKTYQTQQHIRIDFHYEFRNNPTFKNPSNPIKPSDIRIPSKDARRPTERIATRARLEFNQHLYLYTVNIRDPLIRHY